MREAAEKKTVLLLWPILQLTAPQNCQSSAVAHPEILKKGGKSEGNVVLYHKCYFN